LSQNKTEAIHHASLEVLESTGVEVMSSKALDILKEAGAKVDYSEKHAAIPRDLVEEALKRAPKTIKYCARDPENDSMLDGSGPHFTTDGYAPFVRDFETGERRMSVREDLVCWTKIADYLNNIHVV